MTERTKIDSTTRSVLPGLLVSVSTRVSITEIGQWMQAESGSTQLTIRLTYAAAYLTKKICESDKSKG